MPSILTTAILLGFYGFSGEVRDMMGQLSKKSRAFIRDWDNVKGFIVTTPHKPRQLSLQLDFQGPVCNPKQTFCYPDTQELARMQRHEMLTGEKVKLQTVKYRFRSDEVAFGLTSIQLLFTCGFKSPFFTTAVGEALDEEVARSKTKQTNDTDRWVVMHCRKLRPAFESGPAFEFGPNKHIHYIGFDSAGLDSDSRIVTQ